MASKKSAKVICKESCFWVTTKQFWHLVQEDIVVFIGERPLMGKYLGTQDQFLITVNNTVMNYTCPDHLNAFLQERVKGRRKRSRVIVAPRP
jgi:hypothetical protein